MKMDYFIFISKNPAEPWAVYCAEEKKLYTFVEVNIRSHSVCISEAFDYIINTYGKDVGMPHSPTYAVKTTGRMVVNDKVATILPVLKLL